MHKCGLNPLELFLSCHHLCWPLADVGYICKHNAKIMQSNIANFAKQVEKHEVDTDAGEEAMPLTNENLVELDQVMTKDRKLTGKVIL